MNLFVGNLNPQTSENSLRTLFSEFGEIVSVKIPIDSETGLPRGFGFVEMSSEAEAQAAIDRASLFSTARDVYQRGLKNCPHSIPLWLCAAERECSAAGAGGR